MLAWALYDWANSAYATTVMAGFFPIYFKQYWGAGVSVGESSYYLGIANSGASLIIMLLAPLLGAIADQLGARKRLLLLFAFIGILMTALLPLVHQGQWWLAALFYVIATVGFSGSISFYDALIVFVTEPRRLDSVSALGYALGYLGGGLVFAVNVWMTLSPASFGLADAGEAVRLSFVIVALWWALFTLPLAISIREPSGPQQRLGAAIRAGLLQLRTTCADIRRFRTVLLFLLAYWLYIDGVDTIVRMAVDYGLALGFAANNLIIALLITQFVGFPSALVFGHLGQRLGPKTGIYIAIGIYGLVVIWAAGLEQVSEFYALAVVIGLVQGGIQSLSRSLYARLIPTDKTAEFFGFYNMLGKFAAVLGPVLVGWTSAVSGSPRTSILVLLLLFVTGAFFLSRVDVGRVRGNG